jgi:TetR/AcrR family transcriptional regulator, transcriptional repressor for nem operon
MSDKGLSTRKNIISQTLQLFSVKGYYNTSLNDIMEATQLTKGGLYGHFASKEEIWQACYDEAVTIWKRVVFKDVRDISDPIIRIKKTLLNELEVYLGSNVFQGGCYFLNMLVEVAGQSTEKSSHVMKGMLGFSKLLQRWLQEAQEKQMLKPDLNLEEVANFILISLSGCSALYASSKDIRIVNTTIFQCINYIESLRK